MARTAKGGANPYEDNVGRSRFCATDLSGVDGGGGPRSSAHIFSTLQESVLMGAMPTGESDEGHMDMAPALLIAMATFRPLSSSLASR